MHSYKMLRLTRLTEHSMSQLQKHFGMFSTLVELSAQFDQTVVSHFIRSWTWFGHRCPHYTVRIGSCASLRGN